jgi:hypothetical protein
MQLHANHVQERRLAQQTRAQHLERLMIATSGITVAAWSFFFKAIDVVVRTPGGATKGLADLMPDTVAASELRAISALYIPEVDAEARQVWQAYEGFCKESTMSIIAKMGNHKPGDPMPTDLAAVDPKLTKALLQATQAMEAKLIELAKQNRQ